MASSGRRRSGGSGGDTGKRKTCTTIASAEYVSLQNSLQAVLTNQNQLVWWRTVLVASSKSIDYTGTIVNYLVVAGAVMIMHHQKQQKEGGGGGGALAEFVSNASFFTLMLINSLTEVLDAADQLAAILGLAARVGQLFDVLFINTSKNTAQDNVYTYQEEQDKDHHLHHHNNNNDNGLRRVSIDGSSSSALDARPCSTGRHPPSPSHTAPG
jgi:ABC-type uncharacterized transport system fused permease/ATPase subunit